MRVKQMQVKKIKKTRCINCVQLFNAVTEPLIHDEQEPKASYGIFKDGKQTGVVLTGSGLYEAWDMHCKRRLAPSCSSLEQLEKVLENM